MVIRRGLIWILVASVLLVIFGAGVAAQSGEGDPRVARFALVLENRTDRAETEALLDAAAAVITAVNDTFWYQFEQFDLEAARDLQTEVIGVLTLETSPEDNESYQAELRFYPVPWRDREPDETDRDETLPLLSETLLTVALDRAGRYQRESTWEILVAAVERVLPSARPVTTVTFRAEGFRSRTPITVGGLPEWVAAEAPSDPAAEVNLSLRTLRSYDATVDAPGFRPENVRFYLEREPLVIETSLRKYPRHSLALTARGLSWPGLEYTWYDRATRWTLHGGVTTFAWGLTPLRQIGAGFGDDERPDRDAQLVTSLPLTELEIGGGRLLGDRDNPGRWHLSAAGVVRFTHGDLDWGLEPVTPAALRLGVGRERELPWLMLLSQRVSTDFFWPVEEAFLQAPRWSSMVGPVLWHFPVYRLALRVVL